MTVALIGIAALAVALALSMALAAWGWRGMRRQHKEWHGDEC